MITFRVLKKVLKKFVREKHISIKTFDLKSIKIYECRGKDLLGNNVKTNVDYKIFSLNDRYLIYEIPSKLNKNKIEGSFLWYIMNIENYKSYLFLLNYNINYKLSFERLKLIDDVYIYYFGKLSKS
ncbi:MAG TPA: hypothetical protein GXZ48_06945, partial [Acholeplasmataceae bacterium]|nr:hypothetical protein [Acholeplasmataceae bacterium]